MSKNFKRLLKAISLIVVVLVVVILVLPIWYDIDTETLWKLVAILVGAGLLGVIIAPVIKT